MTYFEQGYKAFLDGIKKEQNPFDLEDKSCPHSMKRWLEGWLRALGDRRSN